MRERAFTLIEAMLAVFIVVLIMGLAGGIIAQYGKVLSFSQAKSNTLTTLQVAMQQMLDESREATQIVSPPVVGAATPDLAFYRVDPNAAWPTILPVPRPVPAATFNPGDPSYQMLVHYSLSNGNLLRDVTTSDGTLTSTAVASLVQGLQVTALSATRTEIQLTMQETTRLTVYTGTSVRLRL